MAHPPLSQHHQQLVAETAWLGRLVAELVPAREREDLLQDVLVSAMSVQGPRRNLRAWLATVARNLATRHRQRDHNRQQRERAVARGEAIAGSLESFDAHRAVVDAVRRLSEPYRAVILLRFWEDLPPREVARRLGIPVETVRTRIKRGLAQLRPALDQRAGSRAGWVVPLVSIPEVRAAALLASRASAPAASLLLGSLLLKKGISWAVAIVLSITAYQLWPAATPENDAQTSARPSYDEPAISSAATPQALDDTLALESPSISRVAAASSPEKATVRGRCVAAETGAPLAGCNVRLSGQIVDRALPTRSRFEKPKPVVTGADGRFSFTLEAVANHRLQLHCQATDRVWLQAPCPEPSAGVLDVGDVALQLGTVLLGQTVSDDGASMGNVNFGLIRAGTRSIISPEFEDDGWFRTRALAPGTYRISMQTSQQLVRPTTVDIVEGQRSRELTIVLHQPPTAPTIHGTLVDTDGIPLFGVYLTARRAIADGGVVGVGISKRDGSFIITQQVAASGPLQVHLETTRHNYHRLLETPSTEWGARDLRIVAQPPTAVTIEVVEALSQEPVGAFSVRCIPKLPSDDYRYFDFENDFLDPLADGQHLGGRATIRPVAIGSNRLQVFPANPDLTPSQETVFEAVPGDNALRIVVETRQRLEIHLTDGGAPIVGSRVELLRKMGPDALTLETRTGEPEQLYKTFVARTVGIVLDRGTSNDRGVALLRGPAQESLYVKAVGPGHSPRIYGPVVISADDTVELEVKQGATVLGTIEPSDITTRLPPSGTVPPVQTGLFLREVGGDERRFPPDSSNLTIGPNGAFRVTGVPAGSWRILLHFYQPHGDFRGGGASHTRDLATITGLANGEVREVKLDASGVLPGSLHGRILTDRGPYSSGMFFVQDANKHVVFGLHTDSDGRFEAKLLSGTYRVGTGSDGVSPHRLRDLAFAPNWVTVTSGQRTDSEFIVTPRTLRLRVLESNGEPATNRLFTATSGDLALIENAKTDDHGWLEFVVPDDGAELATFPPGLDFATAMASARAGKLPWERVQLRLGTVQPMPGAPAELVVRIPDGY